MDPVNEETRPWHAKWKSWMCQRADESNSMLYPPRAEAHHDQIIRKAIHLVGSNLYFLKRKC